MPLFDDLMELKLEGRDGISLRSKIKLAGIRLSSNLKKDVVQALEKFLSNEDNIMRVWNSLNSLEQDLLIEFLRSGTMDNSDINYIYAKHGGIAPFDKQYSHYHYYYDRFLPEGSRGRLFLFNKGIPLSIKKVLKPFVKPFEPDYTPLESLPMEEVHPILEISDYFDTDLVKLLQLINKEKLKVTKVNQYPTKNSMLKMNSVLTINEWETANNETVAEIRNIEKSIRLFGLFQLMQSSSLIQIKNGIILLGEKADSFLQMNQVEKCQLLLEGYRSSSTISELGRIPETKIDCEYHKFEEARNLILKNLSYCPLNQWIQVQEIIFAIKKEDWRFLHKAAGKIYQHDRYENYYFSINNWSHINERFIQVVLLEYLAMIGIVDIALTIILEDFSNYYEVAYLRLTPLGGHVLGVNDSYEYKKKMDESGLLIQPNFEILVSEGSMKDIHALYFDTFADKLSEHPVPVYKITFQSIISALDKGLQVQEIIEYLEKYKEHPLPQNVLTTLESWSKESEKIKIRTITVIEAQDTYLIEELKSYKTIGRHILKDLQNTVEIKREDAGKVKREIEKKGRFCLLEE